jgi:hypothetical protein
MTHKILCQSMQKIKQHWDIGVGSNNVTTSTVVKKFRSTTNYTKLF